MTMSTTRRSQLEPVPAFAWRQVQVPVLVQAPWRRRHRGT